MVFKYDFYIEKYLNLFICFVVDYFLLYFHFSVLIKSLLEKQLFHQVMQDVFLANNFTEMCVCLSHGCVVIKQAK